MTESQTPFDVGKFTDGATASFQEGKLLEWLCINRFLRPHIEYKKIYSILIELHNERRIDLILSLDKISNFPTVGQNFWQIQTLYSEIIPELETQPDALMEGVFDLVAKGGQDLAANQPNAAFRKWLKRRPEDTRRLLERAHNVNEPPLKLLTFVLEAGFTQDFSTYFDAAIGFLSNEHIENRLAAVAALGRVDLKENLPSQQRRLDALLLHVTDAASPQEVAQTIRAILDVYSEHSDVDDKRIVAAIEYASEQPTPELHYLLAGSLALNARTLSIRLQVSIIKALELANPSLKGVIDQIDFAFSVSMHATTRTAIADCLDVLLTRPDASLNFDDLNSLTRALTYDHPQHLAWLVLRWLRHGSHEARVCLPSLFHRFSEEGYQLDLQIAEFKFSDSELVFICRKALGYLLLQAATAASILISCLDATSTDTAAEEISDLLFDPLMINFPGQARAVVLAQSEKGGAKTEFLKRALRAHDDYLDGLRSVKNVPELQPSASERRVQTERQRQLAARIFKEAERQSVFSTLVTRQTLLHGTGSVYYVRDSKGILKRSETQLASHGTSIEFPRLEATDPVYLQNIIVRFRVEEFQS